MRKPKPPFRARCGAGGTFVIEDARRCELLRLDPKKKITCERKNGVVFFRKLTPAEILKRGNWILDALNGKLKF